MRSRVSMYSNSLHLLKAFINGKGLRRLEEKSTRNNFSFSYFGSLVFWALVIERNICKIRIQFPRAISFLNNSQKSQLHHWCSSLAVRKLGSLNRETLTHLPQRLGTMIALCLVHKLYQLLFVSVCEKVLCVLYSNLTCRISRLCWQVPLLWEFEQFNTTEWCVAQSTINIFAVGGGLQVLWGELRLCQFRCF